MAEALDDPGGDVGVGRRRRRRRTRRDRRAALLASADSGGPVAAVDAPQDEAADAQVAVLAPSEPDAQPALDQWDSPAAISEAHPDAAAVQLPAPMPAASSNGAHPAEDPAGLDFPDLLGQAVGLRLDSVSRDFGDDDVHMTALKDVSLEIVPCEFVSIVGPSGCGKTTLLSMMGGLDRPTSGHVYAAGLPLDQLSDRDLANYRLQRVSTIFQTFNLVRSMTVEDNVALPLALAGVEPEERRQRARRLLALVGLEDRARTRASRLSGGEQQKVAVARALANRPGLILADEPTGSLDSASGEVILQLLEDINRRGATVVLVTHDPQVARRAHRGLRMIDGRAMELERGARNIRHQDPVEPATRLHWRDSLKIGLGSAGRRPLRTTLTTTGVAIGIAAMSLIVALAGGLQAALSTPALAQSQLHQIAVYAPSDTNASAFGAGTLATLGRLQHVTAAWGEVAMSGTFTAKSAPSVTPAGALVSLPPHAQQNQIVVMAGRLPTSDTAPELLLTDSAAKALGFSNVDLALGQKVAFIADYSLLALPGQTPERATNQVPLPLTVVGVVSSKYMPAGAAGGLVPDSVARTYWAGLAKANGWKRGEFASITLLADSGPAVGTLRDTVGGLGFQTQTFGDQFRNFEDLLVRLRVALLGLAVVALFLACLGIANTMYSAVLERTKEIGVLKALGARSRDVMLLFVIEAAVIGLAGGVVGTVVAAFLARLGNDAVDQLTAGLASGLDVFRPDFGFAIAGLAVAVILSTVSGLLPALRAARQDPVKALGYE